jgi:hypothetical protein
MSELVLLDLVVQVERVMAKLVRESYLVEEDSTQVEGLK